MLRQAQETDTAAAPLLLNLSATADEPISTALFGFNLELGLTCSAANARSVCERAARARVCGRAGVQAVADDDSSAHAKQMGTSYVHGSATQAQHCMRSFAHLDHLHALEAHALMLSP